MYRESPVKVNWGSDLKRKPKDLEGICVIPGLGYEYLAVESGGYRAGQIEPDETGQPICIFDR